MQDHFSVFLLLLNNISVFVVLIVGYSFLIDHLQSRSPLARQILMGLYFGAIVLVAMNVKIPVAEGVIVDQRNALIVLAGAFGGPLAGVVAGAVAAAYRAYLGGIGMEAGIFGVTLSVFVGCALYMARWRGNTVLALFLGAVFAVVFTAPGFLLVGDLDYGLALMRRMLLPWGSAIFTGIFVGGLLLSREDRRLAAEQGRKNSEARFRTLYDGTVIPILDMDYTDLVKQLRALRDEGVSDIDAFLKAGDAATKRLNRLSIVRHANAAAQALYGAKSVDELLGRFDGSYGPENGGLPLPLARAIWNGEKSVTFESVHRTFSGEQLIVSVSLPMPGSIDAPLSRFESLPVTILDITQQKKAEAARDEARLSAEKASRAKSEFLASMSHELRTPLNAILGFSEVIDNQLLGPVGNEKYREYGRDIHTSGMLLMELVNDILDIAAIEAGRKTLTVREVDLDEVVDECLAIVEHRAEEAGVALRKEIADGDGLAVQADRRALQQVLLNLLTNAVKNTPSGGTVSVTAKAGAQGTEIVVSDTGCGIPEDRLEEVTKAFVRGSDDPMVSQDGWGLGLSIAKSLVELHEGDFRIDSTVGDGTAVHITLPRQAD
ncbi:ATP-binding protein [Hwanghaeella sp.]|uniref:ATP-binding protein n=1 Tax=Hwanghaeella sp. TaxID=2605943 RepID=UPI003CCBD928